MVNIRRAAVKPIIKPGTLPHLNFRNKYTKTPIIANLTKNESR